MQTTGFGEWLNHFASTNNDLHLSAWGQAKKWNSSQIYDEVAIRAQFLSDLKLTIGTRAVLFIENSPQADFWQMAFLGLGISVLILDPNLPKSMSEEYLQLFQPKIWLHSGPSDFPIPASVKVIVLDQDSLCVDARALSAIKFTPASTLESGKDFQFMTDCGNQEATVAFSSGTTGPSKMYSYTQSQLLRAAEKVIQHYDATLAATDRVLSWLPMTFLFQRMINLAAWKLGADVCYVSSPKQLLPCLKIFQPTILVGVPQLFISIHQNLPRLLRLFPKITGWILRKKMGGRIRFMISGSAPLPLNILKAFLSWQLPVYEAYGCSECILPIAGNTAKKNKLGSVGKAYVEIQFFIDANEQLFIRSEFLAREAPLTQGMNGEFYYSTGDRVTVDTEGFLSVEGRLDNQIKTPTGYKVFPEKIESKISSLFEGPMAVIDLFEKGLVVICNNTQDVEPLRSQLNKMNRRLNRQEWIQWVYVPKAGFRISKEVTITGKLRRTELIKSWRAIRNDIPDSGKINEVHLSSGNLIKIFE